ncbi:MAG: Mrp/NBP35 family ATP-binding protein [Firmicutes bacterium]|nr:Mrp/NBP35 family ATP-binding protein [Bacillota bacterium]
MSFKHMLAIASGKGGVGKSTVTASLGLAAVAAGHSAGIIDADLHGYSIPQIMGADTQPYYDENENLFPGEAGGVKIVSMGYFVEDNPVIWRSPLYSQALNQFVNDFTWGDVDLLLLDLPPGTGDMPLNVLQRFPKTHILVVTTPQPAAAEVAARVAVMAEKMNASVLGVVENMSWFECEDCGHRHELFGAGGGAKMAKDLNTEVLGQLPLRPDLRQEADVGQLQLRSEFSEVFDRIKTKLNM